MTKKNPTHLISVRLPVALLDRIQQIADDQGTSRSEMIERCLEIGVRDEQEFATLVDNPITREIVKVISQSTFINKVAKMAGKEISLEQVDRFNHMLRNRKKKKGETHPAI